MRLEEKLPVIYHTFTSKDKKSIRYSGAERKVDYEKIERRKQILRLLDEDISTDYLFEKLSVMPSKDAVSGDLSSEYMIAVLREGLFGFLPDEVLLKDIYPQGVGMHTVAKIANDPIWKHVNKYLSTLQKSNTITTFRAIERFAPKLEDDKIKGAYQAKIQHTQLVTLGDARSVLEENWRKISGIGEIKARILTNTFKKIT